MKTTRRGATMGITMLSAKERWLLATMTGPVRGRLSRPSTVGRQIARATGGTSVWTAAYSMGSGVEGQLGLGRAQRRVHAVEQAADRLAGVHPGDRLGEQVRHGPDLQLRPPARGRHGVGGDDLADHRVVAEPFDGLADEQPVRARDGRTGAAELLQLVEQLDDRPAGGDLVVEDDRMLALDVTDDRVDDDPVVGQPLLAAGGDGEAQQPGEVRRGLGVAEVR